VRSKNFLVLLLPIIGCKGYTSAFNASTPAKGSGSTDVVETSSASSGEPNSSEWQIIADEQNSLHVIHTSAVREFSHNTQSQSVIDGSKMRNQSSEIVMWCQGASHARVLNRTKSRSRES